MLTARMLVACRLFPLEHVCCLERLFMGRELLLGRTPYVPLRPVGLYVAMTKQSKIRSWRVFFSFHMGRPWCVNFSVICGARSQRCSYHIL